MSHSIHATRRDPRDPGDLSRKRWVKELVAVERHHDRSQLPLVPMEAIPITVHAESGDVHFPASVADLRGLMARLPPGCLAGVRGIELSLGAHAEGGGEIMSGVFGGDVLGRYTSNGPDIHLHAYVYDASLADRAVFEPYLRLRMLSTFVHEIGHHLDLTTRDARGRWRAEDDDEAEITAEAIEYAWTRDYVIPHLEEAHGGEVAALKAWILEHGGLVVPLDVLVGDPRTTRGKDGIRLFFSVGGAFHALFTAVSEGKRPPETHLDFARELHYGEHYEEALTIIARVLDQHPGHATALTLRADIFMHEGRVDEALAIARGVLLVDGDHADAWEIVRDAGQARGQWTLVLEAASRGVALLEGWRRRSSLVLRTRAHLELAHFEAAEQDLAELSAAGSPEDELIGLRAIALLRSGHPEEALALASRDPEKKWKWRLFEAERAAVRIEAEHLLHRPSDEPLSERQRNILVGVGYGTWIARLDALAVSSAEAPSSISAR
jgi:tetratricopeptide (TPR) repeat protein